MPFYSWNGSMVPDMPARSRSGVRGGVRRHAGNFEIEARMSECIHCDIHDLLEPELARESADLGQIAAKVTEVLADLVLIASPEDRASLRRCPGPRNLG